MAKGERKTREVKHTKATAYVMAYKQGRTVEQIAKFYGVTKHAVECSLYRMGVRPSGNGKNHDGKLQKQIDHLTQAVDMFYDKYKITHKICKENEAIISGLLDVEKTMQDNIDKLKKEMEEVRQKVGITQ